MTTMAVRLTEHDKTALTAIKRAGGYVMRDATGAMLQAGNARPLARHRFTRLVELGALEPSGDALFADIPSQTYHVSSARDGSGWTDERVAALKRLWAEGQSASQIAARIGGVSRNAVIGKVHRLGLASRATRQRSRPPRPAKRPREQDRVPMGETSWPVLVVFPPVKAFVPARPVVEVADVPPALRVKLLDLHDGQCRWPFGDPKTADFGFCGCPQRHGSSFCENHHRRVHR
jgi:GcrA cell cycle regulator